MDLINSLIPRLYGGESYHTKHYNEAKNEELLEDIVKQIDNSKCGLNSVKEGLGVAVAIANQTEEFSNDAMAHVGWGIQFLANLEKALDHFKSDIEYMRRTPDCLEELREAIAAVPKASIPTDET